MIESFYKILEFTFDFTIIYLFLDIMGPLFHQK